jgi:hypothetical protein
MLCNGDAASAFEMLNIEPNTYASDWVLSVRLNPHSLRFSDHRRIRKRHFLKLWKKLDRTLFKTERASTTFLNE